MSTTTELAVRQTGLPSAADMQASVEYAKCLAASGLLPESYRQQPQNVLYAIEYGRTLGITAMAAMTGVHVIKGKPTASAALIGALVRRAGHKLRVTGNGRKAVAQIIRCDDPDFVYESTWELRRNEDGNPNAEEAGLLGKDTWKQFPAAMLKSRAITQVARDACEEVLFGLHYTPEELGQDVDGEGVPVAEVVAAVERKAQREARTEPTDDEFTVEPPAERKAPTQKMAAKLAALVTEKAGTLNDADRHAFTSLYLGREITSWRQLTFTDVHLLIGKLEALEDFIPDAEVVPDSEPLPSQPNPRNGDHTPSPAVAAALATPNLSQLIARAAEANSTVGVLLHATITGAQTPQELERLFAVAVQARDGNHLEADEFTELDQLGRAANEDMAAGKTRPPQGWSAQGMAAMEAKAGVPA